MRRRLKGDVAHAGGRGRGQGHAAAEIFAAEAPLVHGGSRRGGRSRRGGAAAALPEVQDDVDAFLRGIGGQAGFDQEVDHVIDVGLAEFDGRDDDGLHLVLQALRSGLAVDAGLGGFLGHRDRGADRRAPAAADFGHHALDAGIALDGSQLELVGFDLAEVAHGALVVGVALEDLLEQRAGAVVILEHVPLAGLVVHLLDALGLFERGGLLGRGLGPGGFRFQRGQLLVQGLGAAVGRIVLEGAVDQLAGFFEALGLLHHAVGAQVLGLGQALGDLVAHGRVLGPVGQIVQGVGQRLFGRHVVALAQGGETGVGGFQRIDFGGLAADFLLPRGFLGDLLELGRRRLGDVLARLLGGRGGFEFAAEIAEIGLHGFFRRFFDGHGFFDDRRGFFRNGFFGEQIAQQVVGGRRNGFFRDGSGFFDGGRGFEIGERIGNGFFRGGRGFQASERIGGSFFRGRHGFFRNRSGFQAGERIGSGFGGFRRFRGDRFRGRRGFFRGEIGERIGNGFFCGGRGFFRGGRGFQASERIGSGFGGFRRFRGDRFRGRRGFFRGRRFYRHRGRRIRDGFFGRGAHVAQQGIQIEIVVLGRGHAAAQERHRHRRNHAPFHLGFLLGTETRTKVFPRPIQRLVVANRHLQITTPARRPPPGSGEPPPQRTPARLADRPPLPALGKSTGEPSLFRRFSRFELLRFRGGCQRPCIPRRGRRRRR